MGREDPGAQAFYAEARELLGELEQALIDLEENPEDRDLVDRVFRAMHTIKGSGAMFGFDEIAEFTHDVETVFDLVRNNELDVTSELMNLTLSARDHIVTLLESPGDADEEEGRRIIEGMRKLSGSVVAKATQAAAGAQEPEAVVSEETRIVRIRFKPSPDIFLTGSAPSMLMEELCEMGRCEVFAHAGELPSLSEIDPEKVYVYWDILLSTDKPVQEIRDVFIFVEDDCEISVEVLDEGAVDVDELDYKKLGDILLERADVDQDDILTMLQTQRPIGELMVRAGLVTQEQVDAALTEQKMVRQVREARQKKEVASTIRVEAGKLDSLVDLVGELVIVQARLNQLTNAGEDDPALINVAEDLERLTDELRDNTMSLRMLPIGSTFSKFRRLVRDLSRELTKEINLVTSGAETELDKTVIEQLGDPMVHLLRNAIDHGVETPEVRRAAGKPVEGTISLAAEHAGSEVHISIIDDGAGMDAAKLKAKAVERGIVDPTAQLSDKECFMLIFEPGFSTAAQITNVSGRGVGMDVVKRGIENMSGRVEIDSELGVGTRVTVKLPLTLAIINGLQIRVGEEYFVMPLSVVEECVELRGEQEKDGKRFVAIRGEIVPYVRLRELFAINGSRPAIEQVIIARCDEGLVGVAVDDVIGEHQTVIKSLGPCYRNVRGVSGATIKGDGSIALILDVPQLANLISD